MNFKGDNNNIIFSISLGLIIALAITYTRQPKCVVIEENS